MQPKLWTLLVIAAVSAPATLTWSQTSEDALQAVIDALQNSRQLILDETPGGDGTTRAQGMRHLLRLIESDLATASDDTDPAHPGVSRCPTKVCKLGFDNPDNVYLAVDPVDDQRTYRVFGFRGTADLITFQLFDGPFGGGATLTSDDMIVNPDGSYEIFISPNPQPGNWLQSTALTQRFISRVYLVDWENEREPSMQVEVLEEDGSNPIPHITPQTFSARLARLSGQTLTVVPSVFQSLRAAWPTNAMVTPSVGGFGLPNAGFPGNTTAASNYDIGVSDALLITVDNTPSRYQNIQLGNLWLESLDYSSRQVALNREQAHIDDDGKIRYVLAHSDPGVPNWLDISGHGKGTLFMRFLFPDPNDLPTDPAEQVVPVADIRNFLPANHPTVTPAERAARLAANRRAFNRRTNPAGLEFELVPTQTKKKKRPKKKKNKRAKKKFKKSDR